MISFAIATAAALGCWAVLGGGNARAKNRPSDNERNGREPGQKTRHHEKAPSRTNGHQDRSTTRMPCRPRKNSGFRKSDEKSVFDHAGNRREPDAKRSRIGNALQRSVQDEVAPIRDERMAILAAPQASGGPNCGTGRRHLRPPGAWPPCQTARSRSAAGSVQARHPFRFIGDHDHAAPKPRQRSSPAAARRRRP